MNQIGPSTCRLKLKSRELVFQDTSYCNVSFITQSYVNSEFKTICLPDCSRMRKVPASWMVDLVWPFPTRSFLYLLEELLASIL